MNIQFHKLSFYITEDNRVVLVKNHLYENNANVGILDSFMGIELAGGPACGSNTQIFPEGSYDLRYVKHEVKENVLEILQRSEKLEVLSVFEGYDDTNAIRVWQEIKNISDGNICLELANTLTLEFSDNPLEEKRDWHLHRFTNTRFAEALPIVQNFYDLGLACQYSVFRDYSSGNISSLKNIPQAIIENRKKSEFFMFQIEAFSGWQYDIGVHKNKYYLHIGGPNQIFHAWNKVLEPKATYQTVPVAVCSGNSLNAVLGEMTKYRRHIIKKHEADKNLPVIFNEYMHCSILDPWEEQTKRMAPYMAKMGCKYYVIDCGWQCDEPGDFQTTYRKFGTWFESRKRFPNGLRHTADYINSHGMKFGLWIEPEVVGIDNKEMIDFYGEDAFLTRNGEKIQDKVDYLLDYRHPKVIQTMTEALDRMVNEYGVEYIKYDAVPCAYLGTDKDGTSLGDGLEQHMNAFLEWTQAMMERYPHVIFENCAGGGMRMDYKALSMFQLISTSDQNNYALYPYIVGNVFCAVLPEQAAVWAYPVAKTVYDPENEAATNDKVSKEHIVINMLNAMLGRFHMASRLHLLDDEKQALIKEAVDVYHQMTPDKLQAVPYLPKGYTQVDDTFVAVGLKTDKKVYLGVWNLNGEHHVTLDLPEISVKDVTVAYPKAFETKYTFNQTSITIDFTEDEQARLFEIVL